MKTGPILVVSEEKSFEPLCSLLRGLGAQNIQCVKTSGEARRLLGSFSFSMILINTPLPDEFGRDLALCCVDTTSAGVMMLVSADQLGRIADGVEKYGVFLLAKPLSRQLFVQAVRLIEVSRYRLVALEKKNQQLTRRLEDLQFISRAKCALIQYRNMTEEEAHHYIEHVAMDRRISRRDVALDILDTFGG